MASRRPAAGSAYQRSFDPENDPRFSWMKDDLPGGRKLWCHLVVAFSCVAVLGAGFVILGGVFFPAAHKMAMEDSMSLPMVWCIIGIVCGALMVFGSIILGKLIISDKWRKNLQPIYPSMQQTSVRFTRRRNREGEVQLSLPPSYEEAQSAPNPSLTVYTVPPPAYSEGETPCPITPPRTLLCDLPKYDDIINEPQPSDQVDQT